MFFFPMHLSFSFQTEGARADTFAFLTSERHSLDVTMCILDVSDLSILATVPLPIMCNILFCRVLHF